MRFCKKTDGQKKEHKVLKVLAIILGTIVILIGAAYVYVTTHTQLLVGKIQQLTYGEKPINSYDPFYSPMEGVKENGQYKISEIKYSDEYPNSYFDIVYPDENTKEVRPTLIYFHGGGFFAGSKNMGDPMAANDTTALLDDLCAQGYNLVNIDYALVPDYHFPTPLIQANQAFAYLMDHQEEYHLNMNNIVIMGSSAGAIMTSQIGSMITNPDYANHLNITSVFEPEQIQALVIDDAPLDYESFSLACKILVGNYIKGSIYLSDEELSKYNNILHLNEDYPASFLLGSEYRHDLNVMHDRLEELGVENTLVDPFAQYGEEKQHCFVANERNDKVAKEAFDQLVEFLEEKTGR